MFFLDVSSLIWSFPRWYQSFSQWNDIFLYVTDIKVLKSCQDKYEEVSRVFPACLGQSPKTKLSFFRKEFIGCSCSKYRRTKLFVGFWNDTSTLRKEGSECSPKFKYTKVQPLTYSTISAILANSGLNQLSWSVNNHEFLFLSFAATRKCKVETTRAPLSVLLHILVRYEIDLPSGSVIKRVWKGVKVLRWKYLNFNMT